MKKDFKFTHHATPDIVFTAKDNGDEWIVGWKSVDYGCGSVEYSYEEVARNIAQANWRVIK